MPRIILGQKYLEPLAEEQKSVLVRVWDQDPGKRVIALKLYVEAIE